MDKGCSCGNDDQGLSNGRELLLVANEAAVLDDPGERALDDLVAR